MFVNRIALSRVGDTVQRVTRTSSMTLSITMYGGRDIGLARCRHRRDFTMSLKPEKTVPVDVEVEETPVVVVSVVSASLVTVDVGNVF